jgi:uncharacterized protein
MKIMHSFHHKIQTLVLQPTPFCNINCRYCYLPDRQVNRVMTSAVLTRIFEEIFSSSLLAESVSLLWHAGEPLVVPIDFYREAFALIQRLNTQGVRIVPTLQTNGMLLSQEWCDFITHHDIRVGISLDGPQYIHDSSRIDRKGRGTFARALRGIQLLQENGIEPSIIMVLTKDALNYPDEIWQFFREQRLNDLSFNIEEVNGAHTRSSLTNEEGVKEKYKQFLSRILQLNLQEEQPSFVREINTFQGRIKENNTVVRSQENIAGTLVSFDYTGNVSTFASELLTMVHQQYGNFLLGNIFDGTLTDLLASPKLLAINDEIQRGVARCQETCAYFGFCGGGSPANKFSEHGTLDATETLYCQLKIQATFDVVLEHLESRYPAITQ